MTLAGDHAPTRLKKAAVAPFTRGTTHHTYASIQPCYIKLTNTPTVLAPSIVHTCDRVTVTLG